MSRLSIIIPVYNEEQGLGAFLQPLVGMGLEIIVVDGGSQDNTLAIAKEFTEKVFISPQKGRAAQMNYGAEQSSGDILLFLHADTHLPESFSDILKAAHADSDLLWGRFDVKLSGKPFIYRIIERLINWRSRLSGIATGDQAIFVSRQLFFDVGGFADIPLMEDIALSKKIKKIAKPLCLKQKVITSSRRWEEKGVFKTIALMWYLRFAFFLGVKPEKLVKQYYPLG